MMFEMSNSGCLEATEYLKSIGEYERFLANSSSTDGYSLVATANSFKEREE